MRAVRWVGDGFGTQGFEGLLCSGIRAPAGKPPAIVEALSQATAKAMGDPVMQEQLAGLGIEPVTGSNPAAAAAYIRSEQARWKPVIEANGIRVAE